MDIPDTLILSPDHDDPDDAARDTAGRRPAALVLALALLTTLAVLAWTGRLDGEASRPARPAPPAAGTRPTAGADFDWSIGYGPGSYLYNAQVPAAARTPSGCAR
jgi:hypothetical protein